MTEKNQKSKYSIREIVHFTAWTVPEINAWALGGYEILLPKILNYVHKTVPQFKTVDKAWGLADGICTLLIGIVQLTDTESPYIFYSRIKGLMNVYSGAQLIILIALLSPLLPYAFATLAINDLVVSMIPLIHALRRVYDENYKINDNKIRAEHKLPVLDAAADQKELKLRGQETIIFVISAIGWILMCIPGMQIPALFFIAAAIVLYFGKNATEAHTFVTDCLNEDEPEQNQLT